MDFFIHQVALLKQNHPIAFALVLVPVVTVVLNVAIYFFTSPRWSALKAKWPRWAAFFKLLQAIGIDPVSLLKSAYQIVTGRPWTPPPSDCPPKAPSDTSAKGLFGATLTLCLVLAGCAAMQTPNVEHAEADFAVCVLDHMGEPAEQVMVTCGAKSIADVLAVQNAHKAAMARAGVSPDGGPPCK